MHKEREERSLKYSIPHFLWGMHFIFIIMSITEQLTKETMVKNIIFDSDNFQVEDNIIKLKNKIIITDPNVVKSGGILLKSTDLNFKSIESSTFLEMSSQDFFYIKLTRDSTFDTTDTDFSSIVFTGTALNDMSVSGIFTLTNPLNYRIEIDSVVKGSISSFAVVSSGTITLFAANGGVTTVTSNSHGLALSDTVSISGTTNYNGTFVITNVTVNTFDINVAFGADESGPSSIWQKDPTKTKVTTSAAHGLTNMQQVNISGTTNYNGNFTIEQVTSTEFVIIKSFVTTETGSWEAANTFKWSDSGGTTFNATLVPISGIEQTLNNGVQIKFANIGSHSLLNVGTTTFLGSGQDDLSTSGTFTGVDVVNYRVEIESLGTPDTFRWSKDNGITFEASGIAITGSAQLLDNGVSIQFTNTSSHLLSSVQTAVFTGTGLNDLTTSGTFTGNTITNYVVEIDGVFTTNTFKWSNDNGVTFQATNVPITGSDQLLENGVMIKFTATTGHTLQDKWIFNSAPNDTWIFSAHPNDRWDFTVSPPTVSHILKTNNFCYNNKDVPLTLLIANGTLDLNPVTEVLSSNMNSKDVKIDFVLAS